MNENAAKILQKRTSNKIAVVSIFGTAKSGKSFLLNQLLKVKGAFDVLPKQDPKVKFGSQQSSPRCTTKGLWIYADPITIEKEGDVFDIFFVDSEGIDDVTSPRDTYESNPDREK